jgi:predicted dinucleotide-binding enzyme
MKIVIIGTGSVGRALGINWSSKGHQVIFASRDPHSERVASLLKEAGELASAALVTEAVAAAPVVVLATPWNAAEQAIESAGDLSGKILVDCTNPIAPGLQLATSTTTSGGEQVAGWSGGALVVKAFNTTGAENMADPLYGNQRATMFICGDDPEAKGTVTGLAEDLGFDVADVGPLSAARFLEPMALVWIRLAMAQGMGRDIAFKLLER